MPDFSPRPASPEDYAAPRRAAGLTLFPVASARIALANTLHAVWMREGDRLVGMGRVTGDGACFVQITDIAVDPAFQGKGLGSAIVSRLMAWCRAELPAGCHVSLLADPGAGRLHERAGFGDRAGMAQVLR